MQTVQSTNNIEFENLDDLMAKLKDLQSSNPKMKKQLNALMREVIKKAVKKVKNDAKSALPNDPRKAFNAVRSSVYKRIFGGQVNILQRRKNNGRMYVGGAHSRPMSSRTRDIEGYYGSDRGFILRFINAGVDDRVSSTMNAHGIRRTSVDERPPFHYRKKGIGFKAQVLGFRGPIKAKNWFLPSATQSMQDAASQFTELVDRAIVELWNE